MNGTVYSTVLLLIISLHAQDGMAWRRRRRVSHGLHKRQIEEQLMELEKVPSMENFCALHGEYIMKNGRLVPCDLSGIMVDGLKCNKDLCWKDTFCWQCRLKTGTKSFKLISLDNLNDIVCEDVQCLYGKKDTGLEYYTTNSSESIPLSNGPFTCSSYLCMSNSKCWKCRLNEEIEQFQLIRKGNEFRSRVSCCPIPKTLISVVNSNGGYYKSDTSTSKSFTEKFDNYLEMDEQLELMKPPSITVEFTARKLIVGIVLLQKGDPSHFSVSYSNDGQRWKIYREYNRIAVLKSSPALDASQRTLFKPLLARYLRIKPFNGKSQFEVSFSISGCGISSNN